MRDPVGRGLTASGAWIWSVEMLGVSYLTVCYRAPI